MYSEHIFSIVFFDVTVQLNKEIVILVAILDILNQTRSVQLNGKGVAGVRKMVILKNVRKQC
jgi:hypothetical protein